MAATNSEEEVEEDEAEVQEEEGVILQVQKDMLQSMRTFRLLRWHNLYFDEVLEELQRIIQTHVVHTCRNDFETKFLGQLQQWLQSQVCVRTCATALLESHYCRISCLRSCVHACRIRACCDLAYQL